MYAELVVEVEADVEVRGDDDEQHGLEQLEQAHALLEDLDELFADQLVLDHLVEVYEVEGFGEAQQANQFYYLDELEAL